MGSAQNLIRDGAFVNERDSKKIHLMVQRNLFFERKHVPGAARGVWRQVTAQQIYTFSPPAFAMKTSTLVDS